jgi:hypothetical protein
MDITTAGGEQSNFVVVAAACVTNLHGFYSICREQ